MKKSEANEQIAVIDYCELRNYPIFAIPNGGSRNQLEAANLKRQGVKSGVPDLCVPVAKHNYHGMYIEMKVGRNKPTDNQIKWLRMLKENGYKFVAKTHRLAYGMKATYTFYLSFA